MPEPQWGELSPDEIMLALQSRAAASQPAVTAFLDVHQWSSLQDDPALLLSAPHPHSQFRQIGMGVQPQFEIVRIDPHQSPAHLRNPRSLRRALEHAAPDGAVIGDLVFLRDFAFAAVTDAAWLSATDFTWEPTAWPAGAPAAQTTSIAALRLDAVVARCFNVSRGEAQVAITHGFVFVDFRPCEKTARTVAVGSSIVFRGKGRVELLEATLNQRSGRTNLVYCSWPV